MEVVDIVRGKIARYKILSAGIVILLLATNVSIHTAVGVDKTTKYTVILYDNFDDNIKNTTLWREVFTDGTWEEKSQRVEFELVEKSRYLKEGIESAPLNVTFSSNRGLQVNWTIITSIGSSSWVGTVRLRVIDITGDNWIDAYYWRWRDSLRYKDSVDDKDIVIKNGIPDGIWNNTLIIYGNRYRVIMGGIDSGWINKTIFPEHAQIRIQIFITNAGSTPGLVQRSAFDNIVVSLIEEKTPTSLQVNWTYPSSNFFERWMHYPYEVKLNVSAGALPDGKKNFSFGLDYNFTAYNLLGEEIQPEWELNEKSSCRLLNSSHNQTYIFGTTLNTTIYSNDTEEWNFVISNRWNWIEPWSMKRILNIILSIATSYSGALYYEELQELLSEKDFEEYAETISSFINAVWHLRYNYHGLGNSSSYPGNVDVWVGPVKPSLLVESLIAAHIASKATSSGFTAMISPFVGWGIAAALFAIQGSMWVVSEITYASSVDPDYNFTTLASPENTYPPIEGNLTDGQARNLTLTAFDLLSFAEARKVSYARYLGAVENNSPKWAALQLAATKYYGEKEKNLTENLRMQLEEILKKIPSPTDDDVKAIKDMLASEGLPDSEVEILKYLGYTDQDITDLTDFYLNANTSFYKSPSSILYLLENMSALIETSNNLLPPLTYDKLISTEIEADPHIIDADETPEYIDFYIEFNDPSAVRGVKIDSCKLNDIVDPVYISETPGDYDGDSLPDILVRFNTSDVIPFLAEGTNLLYVSGNATLSSVDDKIFCGIVDIVLQGEPPVTTLEMGNPRYGKWITTGTPLRINATDDLSGVKYLFYTIEKNGKEIEKGVIEDNSDDDCCTDAGKISHEIRPAGEGNYTIACYSMDGAGNMEKRHIFAFCVDDTSPISKITIGQPCYFKDKKIWVSEQTKINISAEDSGCGVSKIVYSVDGDKWVAENDTMVTITLRGECKHKIRWYAVDHLGNTEETHMIVIYVDNKAPETEFLVGEPHLEKPLFVTSHTKFRFNATDSGECSTGVKAKWYRVWNIFSGWSKWKLYRPKISAVDGIEIVHKDGLHYIEFYSEDFVGNIENIHNITCYVDDIPPRSRAYCIYPNYIYIEAEDKDGGELIPAVGGCRIHYRYKVGDENWTEWNISGENETVIIHLTWPDNIVPIDKPIHVEYYAVDALGNKEDLHHDTFTIERSKTNP